MEIKRKESFKQCKGHNSYEDSMHATWYIIIAFETGFSKNNVHRYVKLLVTITPAVITTWRGL
jgi:hypothetical protein